MAKRRYTSRCSKYSIHLERSNGDHIIHEFKGKNVYTKERYTDVTDSEIQKLLESSSGFGVYFELSHEFDWMEVEENAQAEETNDIQKIDESQTEESNVKVFATGTEAKNWLSQTMKVPSYKLGNKAKMIEEAELIGYSIEFEVK